MSGSGSFLKSSAILVSIKFIQRSLGLISTLILARLLTPEDFGIVAVALLIIYFSEVLSNTGMQQYLVQAETVDNEVVSTAWTLNILMKSAVCLLLYLALPLIKNLYDNPLVVDAIAVLIPVILIRALMSPELHIHRRNLEYDIIFKISIVSKFISFLVVVAVAFYSRTFWAIIIGDIVSAILGVFLSYVYCRKLPGFSVQNIRKQWQFSRWMIARGFLGYSRTQIDTLLVSQFFNLNQLGNFSIAREFTVMPASEVITPAVEPLLATFSKVRADQKKLQAQFCLALAVIFSFVSPVSGFIFFYHNEIVLYILGEKWLGSAVLMQAMTPLLLAFSLSGVLNSICICLGKLKSVFFYDFLTLFLLFLILYSARDLDMDWFVWVRSAIALAAIVVFLAVCASFINLRFLTLLVYLFLPLFLGFLISAACYTFIEVNSLLSLLFIGINYVLIYVAVLYFVVRFLSSYGEVWESLYLYLGKIMNAVKARLLL